MTTKRIGILDTLPVAPPLPKNKRTSFDISRTEAREVVFSQWYRYYLDRNEDHGLGNLFIDALLSLTQTSFTLEHFNVETEVKTRKGNFIDILICGIGSDQGKYVIIENKIFHHLHNDLDDYWDYCGVTGLKLGVLLTLRREPTSKCKMFQNVLHLDWIRAVEERMKGYELTTDQHYNFENFKHAIYNLNRYTTMNEHVTYYFENTDAINRAIACKGETERYISLQIASAAKQLEMTMDRTDSPRLRDLLVPGLETEVFYSVIFDGLFTPDHELRIVLGLKPQHLNRVQELDKLFKAEAESLGFKLNDHPGKTWHNYLTQRFQLTHDQWVSLDDFIVQSIKQDFHPLAQRIGQHLKQNCLDAVTSKSEL